MTKPFKFPRHRRVSRARPATRGLKVVHAKVQEALEIVRKEFATALREKDVVKRLGVSASYFRSLFKKCTGRSFLRYLREYRVARGNALMWSDPTMRMKELYPQLGYKRLSALDRDYKKYCGRSPKSVRKSRKSRFG